MPLMKTEQRRWLAVVVCAVALAMVESPARAQQAATAQEQAAPAAAADTQATAPMNGAATEQATPVPQAQEQATATQTVPAAKVGPCKGKHCPKAKKVKKKKEKPPVVTPVTITRGLFTVDGVIGKAALNYRIADLKFIYFYLPGVGTVLVSNNKFAGAVEEQGAFQGQTLKVTAGGHEMELYSDEVILGRTAIVGKGGKNAKPSSAWVALDEEFLLKERFPVVGYGTSGKAPYEWPGSKVNTVAKGADKAAPPIPKVLKPKLELPPCPEMAATGSEQAAGPAMLLNCTPASTKQQGKPKRHSDEP